MVGHRSKFYPKEKYKNLSKEELAQARVLNQNEAIRIAKRYNFVTNLTSLVVTTDQVEKNDEKEDPSKTQVPTTIRKSGDSNSDGIPNNQTSNAETLMSPPVLIDVTTCQGTIHLFFKTQLRGQNVTLTSSSLDLGKLKFDKMAASLKVDGNCCWVLFTEINFTGDFEKFTIGEYPSGFQLKNLLKNTSSVKKSDIC